MAGKGSRPRKQDSDKWENAPFWRNREIRIKKDAEKKNGRLRSK